MKKKVERRSVCIAKNKEKKQGKKVERKGECDSALENSTEEPKWRPTWASRKRDSEGRRRVAASSSPPLQVLALRDPELGRGYGFSTLPSRLLSSPTTATNPKPRRQRRRRRRRRYGSSPSRLLRFSLC
jgi:hypothetical protein